MVKNEQRQHGADQKPEVSSQRRKADGSWLCFHGLKKSQCGCSGKKQQRPISQNDQHMQQDAPEKELTVRALAPATEEQLYKTDKQPDDAQANQGDCCLQCDIKPRDLRNPRCKLNR